MRRRCSWPASAALKVKRAVRFPFLDYSTLDKRKAACETELAINRRTAPDIYRRVVAITREADGRLALDGRGEPVEWAVEMRRFDESADARPSRRGGQDRRGAGRCARPHRGGVACRCGARRCRALDRRARKLYRRACRRLRPAARSVSGRAEPGVRGRRPRRLRAHPSAAGRARAARDSSAASTATCISAISCCSTTARCCSTPSSSARSSRPATCSTISPSC